MSTTESEPSVQVLRGPHGMESRIFHGHLAVVLAARNEEPRPTNYRNAS